MDTAKSKKEKLYKPHELADMLGLTVAALAKARYRRQGIPFVRVGRSVRYRESVVAEYLDAHQIGKI